MTASDLALMLDARRTGTHRWMATCPAHDDAQPSLSIGEGTDGRLLIHCFGQCSVNEILAALKLTARDLFSGPPPSPERLAAIQAERSAREQAERAIQRERATANDRVRKLGNVVDELGAKLARDPESDALSDAFHQACDLLHDAETEADALGVPQRRYPE